MMQGIMGGIYADANWKNYAPFQGSTRHQSMLSWNVI